MTNRENIYQYTNFSSCHLFLSQGLKYIAQADLRVRADLNLPHVSRAGWGCRSVSSHFIYVSLRLAHKASCTPGKHSTTEFYLQPLMLPFSSCSYSLPSFSCLEPLAATNLPLLPFCDFKNIIEMVSHSVLFQGLVLVIQHSFLMIHQGSFCYFSLLGSIPHIYMLIYYILHVIYYYILYTYNIYNIN